jgi:rhodanese-related sulfurtransferase
MLLRMALLLLLAVPAQAEPDRYLFYLHGRIVEGSDGRPVHSEYGAYEYPAIVAALRGSGFTVISEIRPADTDGLEYAGEVVAQIDSLMALGIAAENISVLGMSKGGGIALAASVRLGNPNVNFVMTGTCYGQPADMPPLEMRGRVLLIHEATDPVTRPCTGLHPAPNPDLVFRRLQTHTGRGHGAFFRPDPAWLAPAVAWCRRDDTKARQVETMYDDYRSDFSSAAEVDAQELADWIARDEAVLVDVRKPAERAVSSIPGSVTRDQYERGDYTGKKVVSYCTIGYRSGKYTEQLSKRGIEAFNLEAGILGWVHDFRPVERDDLEVCEVHVYGQQWNLLPSWYKPIW